MPVKNIIFDLGGVIIEIEPERTLAAFQKHMGGRSLDNVYQHPLFHDFETGKITPEDFREAVRRELNFRAEDALIDECLTAMLGEIPKERMEVLERMKKHYNTFLLSNTNAIHLAAISRYLQKIYLVSSLDGYFQKAYYSHLAGWRKPDVRIFELVLRENNLKPDETLFLDDTPEHLKSAESLGIATIRVTPENGIADILKEY